MVVILVQHGEKHSGVDDPGLTPTGVHQARACARLLGSDDLVAIFSSPARRCRETAQPIADAAGLTMAIEEALGERMSWVPSSGQSFNEFLTEWERTTDDRDFVPSIGDSSRATGARMARAVERLSRAHPAGNVVCVSHGGATVDLLRDVVGDEALSRVAPGIVRSGMPGGAVTTILTTPSGLRAVGIAVVDHIPEADRTGHLAG